MTPTEDRAGAEATAREIATKIAWSYSGYLNGRLCEKLTGEIAAAIRAAPPSERDRVKVALTRARETTNSLYSDLADLLTRWGHPCVDPCQHAHCPLLRALGQILEERRTEIFNARRADDAAPPSGLTPDVERVRWEGFALEGDARMAENAKRPTVEGAVRARILSDDELRMVVDTAGAVIGERDSDGKTIWIADILETARHERAWRQHYNTMATITAENNQKLREQRDAFKGAFQILFNCHHGDEATCGCREHARTLIAAHATPSNVGHDGPTRSEPVTPKAQRSSGPSGDVERVVRAAGRLSPGVWRQLGKWLRTREGTAGPWDPDDPPVLAQIANEVDEIADALAALRVAPAASGEEK